MIRSVLTSMWFGTALAAILVAVSASKAPARTCGSNLLFGGCAATLNGPPANTASYSYSGPWQAGDPCTDACYDMRQGLVIVNAASTGGECHNEAWASDLYDLVGMPPGEPVTLTARFHVTGVLSADCDVVAKVSWGVESTGTFTSADSPLDEWIDLPVTPYEDGLFGISLELSIRNRTPGSAPQVQGVLHFTDVPAGAHVTSCYGYALPVPALGSSWGRVKAQYR